MLGPTPTKQEIISYLTDANLEASYVCGDNTLCRTFKLRINPVQVAQQLKSGGTVPQRIWWIEFDEETNKFILRCSYFDKNENPITYQEFVEQMISYFTESPPDNLPPNLSIQEWVERLPAVAYKPETNIEWVSTAYNEWTASYNIESPTIGWKTVGVLNNIFYSELTQVGTHSQAIGPIVLNKILKVG